jgi:hypothetical protein
MVAIWDHPDSKRYGIGIVAPVHDEILIEGWMENRKEVLNLLTTCMSNSAKGIFEVQMVCDGVLETCWNLGHFVDKVQKEYKKNGGDRLAIYSHYPETAKEFLDQIIDDKIDVETSWLVPADLE